MCVWLISDTHFGHTNIGRYCNRPEGWEELIWKNLEACVQPYDVLIHLGDVALVPRKDLAAIVARLPGDQKFLVEGNHDKRSRVRTVPGWTKVYRYGEVMRGWMGWGIDFVATHRPQDFKDPPGAGVLLSGHVHDRGPPWSFDECGRLRVNLSVEQWDYRPVRLSAIMDIYNNSTRSSP